VAADPQWYRSNSRISCNSQRNDTVGQNWSSQLLSSFHKKQDVVFVNCYLFSVWLCSGNSKLMFMFLSNRLLNAGSRSNLALNVVDGAGNPACDILEIAVDGIYLNCGKPPRLGRSFIVTGSRIDWLIVCNNPGTYYVSFQNILVFLSIWICNKTLMIFFMTVWC